MRRPPPNATTPSEKPFGRDAAVRDAHESPSDTGFRQAFETGGDPTPAPECLGTSPKAFDAGEALLDWYDLFGRQLPWRVRPEDWARGVRPDPYRVWLSEIMLQQTRVTAVIPYFNAFLRRWPTVEALANAPVEAVMASWAGLGYYARARNLHACSRQVASRHDGCFPAREEELRALPGIGLYTAAAVAAIAFNEPAVPVDGNVERVMARFHGVQDPLPGANRKLRSLALSLAPSPRPGDLAQALMDLGATVCTPRKPDCPRCPLRSHCKAHRNGWEAQLPRRVPRRVRPVRRGVAYLAMRRDGAVWLVRRPAEGLLGGMLGLPGTAWTTGGPTEKEASGAAPFFAPWRKLDGEVSHVFTHFELRLSVRAAIVDGDPDMPDGRWVAAHGLDREALPKAMKKAVEHGVRQVVPGAPEEN